jgi:hypothetical protein
MTYNPIPQMYNTFTKFEHLKKIKGDHFSRKSTEIVKK